MSNTPYSSQDILNSVFDASSGKLKVVGGSGGSTQWGNISGTLANQTDLNTALNSKINSPDNPVTGEFLKKTATGWETAEVDVDATRIVDGQCEITATGGITRMGAWTMNAFSRSQYATFSEGATPAPYFDWHRQCWVLAPAGTFSVDYDDGEYSMTGANCAKVYATDAAGATELHFIIDKDGEEGTVAIGTATGAAASGESGTVAVVPDSNSTGYIPENALLMMGADGKLAKAVESASAQEGQFVCRTADGWGVGSVTVPVTDVTVDGSSVVSSGVAVIPVSTSSTLGVVKTLSTYGIYTGSGNYLYISYAKNTNIDSRAGLYNSITAQNLNYAVRSVVPNVTTIPAETSAYILLDATATTNNHSYVYTHAPSSAPTYTLPSVTDTTVTHEIVLYIDCTTTASFVFHDSAGSTITPKASFTPAVGDKVTALCRYEFGSWVVYLVQTVEGA